MKKWISGPVAATALLGATVVVAPTPVHAQSFASTTFSSTSSAAYVGLDATLGPQEIVDLELFPSDVVVDTGSNPRSLARGANLDATLFGAIDLSGILTEVDQSASALGENPLGTTETLVAIPADPIADIDVSNATVHARWFGDGACPAAGVPYARSRTDVAQAELLDSGGGVHAVSLVNDVGGAAATQTWTELQPGAGTGYAVESVAQAQALSAMLFAGTPAETLIEIAGTFEMSATADGTSGGAVTDVSWPLVTITMPGGAVIGPIEADDLDPIVTPLDGLLDGAMGAATLGSIHIETGAISVDTTSVNGTSAEIAGAVLTVDLDLQVGGEQVLLADLDIAPLATAVSVPAGGLICLNQPLDIHKAANASVVNPGQVFDYQISFTNYTGCTLTDVEVTDTLVQAVSGSTIAGTSPTAVSIDGLVTRWTPADIPDLGSFNATLSIRVPSLVASAQSYVNEVEIEGICEGRRRTGRWVHQGPGVQVTTTTTLPPPIEELCQNGSPPPCPTTTTIVVDPCPNGSPPPCEKSRGGSLASTGSGSLVLFAFSLVLAVMGMLAVGKQRELELRQLALAIAENKPKLKLRLKKR